MRSVVSQVMPTQHGLWTWTVTPFLGVDGPLASQPEARGARSGARCSSYMYAPAAIARPCLVRIADALLCLIADAQLHEDSFHAPTKSSGLGWMFTFDSSRAASTSALDA